MKKKRIFLLIVVCIVLAPAGFFYRHLNSRAHRRQTRDQTAPASSWDVARIDTDDFKSGKSYSPDRVYFNNGTKIDNLGYQLKYLGKLKANETPPILLFSGRECIDCEEGLNFYVYSVLKSAAVPYSYPAGKVSSQEDGGVFYEGRGFFGKCFSDGQEGVIAYGNFMNPDRTWRKVITTYTFQPDGTFLGKEVDAASYALEDTLSRVSQGICHEMPKEDYSEGAQFD